MACKQNKTSWLSFPFSIVGALVHRDQYMVRLMDPREIISGQLSGYFKPNVQYFGLHRKILYFVVFKWEIMGKILH